MALQMPSSCWFLLLCTLGTRAMRATEDNLDADLVDDEIDIVPWATLDNKTRNDLLQHGFKNNACYCKKVKSDAECPSEEEGDPRWYHELKGEDNNLCCKIANTGFFTYVGWSYTKMDRNFSLCESEIRPVPATSCCWLDGLVANPVGIRVSRVSADLEVDLHAYSQKSPVVHKSGFNFRIEDITGGKNYNSAAVDVFDVRQFVEYNHKAGRFDKLRCRKTLFQEDHGFCVVREKAASACCCHKASLVEATRCLPAPKAPKQQTVIVLPQSQDRRQLTTMPRQTYMEEDNMPKTLSSIDPEAEDDFDTRPRSSGQVIARRTRHLVSALR